MAVETPAAACKLGCANDNESYLTGENVVDGTPCSYADPDDVCVQGECVRLGCDKVIEIHFYEVTNQSL
jgi:hypothetical protein